MRPKTTVTAAATIAALLAAAACGSNDAGHESAAGDSADAPPMYAAPGGPQFQDYGVNPETATAEDNQSTFALDVDTGSYTVTRGYLNDGFLPDPAAVRTEEFVNYFAQDYQPPPEGIGIHVDGTTVPFLDDPSKRVIRVGLQAATVDDSDREPANLTVVVDTSGSMAGHNMEMVRAGMGRLIDTLRPDDAVAIVTFSDDSDLLLPMTPMTEEPSIRQAIAGLSPDASTNLEAGLRLGYAHARDNLRSDGSNRVILLSDGVANVGETDPAALADQIAQDAGRETQLLVVGVGRGTYSDVVLEQFANNGNGFYAYMDTVREAERLFVHDLTGTLQAIALDARVQVTFNTETVTHFRLLGFENRLMDHDDFRDDDVDGGEIGAGHNVTALYEVTVPEGGEGAADEALATVDVRWIDPATDEAVEVSATLTAGELAGSFPDASQRLRQDVLVAAFAECLRGAPWAERVSLVQVADNAASLARDLPDDDRLGEFADLARVAADLSS